MLALGHEPADERRSFEIELLRGQQRVTNEVRDDPLDEIIELARLHFNVLSLRSGRMLPHPKLGLQRVEHLGSISVLARDVCREVVATAQRAGV